MKDLKIWRASHITEEWVSSQNMHWISEEAKLTEDPCEAPSVDACTRYSLRLLHS